MEIVFLRNLILKDCLSLHPSNVLVCQLNKSGNLRYFVIKVISTIAQRLKIIMDQREAVEEQITELQDALDVLKYKTWLYEVALEAGTTAVHDNMPLADMPKNIQKIKERIRRLTDDMEQRYTSASQNKEKK